LRAFDAGTFPEAELQLLDQLGRRICRSNQAPLAMISQPRQAGAGNGKRLLARVYQATDNLDAGYGLDIGLHVGQDVSHPIR